MRFADARVVECASDIQPNSLVPWRISDRVAFGVKHGSRLNSGVPPS